MSPDFIISHAYARHVPDMERGFTIQTNYGDLTIEASEAEPFQALLRKTLEARLTTLNAEAGNE